MKPRMKRFIAFMMSVALLIMSMPMDELQAATLGQEEVLKTVSQNQVSFGDCVSQNDQISDNGEDRTEEIIAEETVSENTISENAEDVSGNVDSVSGGDVVSIDNADVFAVNYMDSGILAKAGRSKQSMRALFDKIESIKESELYSVLPVYAPQNGQSYSTGTLSEKNQRVALAYLNYARYAAGLYSTVLNASLANQAQYGAVLLAATGQLSHTPSKPSKMTTEFYNMGYNSTSSSNISMGYTFLTGHLKGCLSDTSSASNLLSVGHRRWLLNPKLYNVGFGQAGNFTLTQVFDTQGASGDYNFVAWPASGDFPKDLFGGNTPWSVTLNPDKYGDIDINKVTVSLKCLDNGVTDSFNVKNVVASPTVTTKYMTVNKGGYGVSNCIIFNTGRALDGNNYEVNISGITDKSGNSTQIRYKVSFFNITSVKASCITINPASMNLTLNEDGCQVGSTYPITITDNALFDKTDQTIKWKSSKNSVATITPAGNNGTSSHKATLTIVGSGKTTITAENAEGNTATCVVNIYKVNPNDKLQGELIKIDDDGVEGYQVGERFDLKIFKKGTYETMSPIQYDMDWFSYKSSKSDYAVIDAYGRVTMVSPGEVTLTATLKNDPDGRKVTKKITVLKKQVAGMEFSWDKSAYSDREIIYEYETTSSNGTVSTRKGEKHQIGVAMYAKTGEKVTDTNAIFASTDTTVAKVTSDGLVTFVGPGTCSIVVTANDTLKYSQSLKIVLKEYEPRLEKKAVTFNQAMGLSEQNELIVHQAFNTSLPGVIGRTYDNSEIADLGVRFAETSGWFELVGYTRTKDGGTFIFDVKEDSKVSKSGKATITMPITMEDNSVKEYSFNIDLKATYSIPSAKIKLSNLNLNILNDSGTGFAEIGNLTISNTKGLYIDNVELVPYSGNTDVIYQNPFEVVDGGAEYTVKGSTIAGKFGYKAKDALLSYLQENQITDGKEIVSRINREYYVSVYYEGYDMPYEKKVKIKAAVNNNGIVVADKEGIFYAVPSSLRNVISIKDGEGNLNAIPVKISGVTIGNAPITVENGIATGGQFDVAGGEKIEIFAKPGAGTDKSSYKFNITVMSDRLLVPYTFAYKVSVKPMPTKVKISKKTVTIYRDKEERAQTFRMYVAGQSEAYISSITEQVMFKKQVLSESPFEFNYNGQNITVDVVKGKTIEAGTYKVTFSPVFEYVTDAANKVEFNTLSPITMNIVVNASVPKAKLSKSSVTLDKHAVGQVQKVTLTPAEKINSAYGVTYVAASDIQCTEVKYKGQSSFSPAIYASVYPTVSMDDKGVVSIYLDEAEKECTPGFYRYRFKPGFANEDGTHICGLSDVVLTVQVTESIPKTALAASTLFMPIRDKVIKSAQTKLVYTSGLEYGAIDLTKSVITYIPEKSTYKSAGSSQIPMVEIGEDGVISVTPAKSMEIKEATYVYTIQTYLQNGMNLGKKTLTVQTTFESLNYTVTKTGEISLNNRMGTFLEYSFKLEKNHGPVGNAYLNENSLFTIVKGADGKNFTQSYDGSVKVKVRAKTVAELTAMYAQTGGNNTTLEQAKELAYAAFHKKNNLLQVGVALENGDVLISGKQMISVKQASLKGKVTGRGCVFEAVKDSKTTVTVNLSAPKDKKTGELLYPLDHISSAMTADQDKAFDYKLEIDENGVGHLTIILANSGVLKANKSYKLKFYLQGENNSADGGAAVSVTVDLKK